MRLVSAIKAFFAILFKGDLSDDLLAQLRLSRALPPAEKPKEDPRKLEAESNARAVQMLALLQRDGRLIDFLQEDIRSYSDAQVGAAVRTLHANCRQVVERYVPLEPIMGETQGQAVTVEDGFDPSEIKVIGNVVGKPPFKGALRHKGWKAVKVELPSLGDNRARFIIAPAEVEVS